MSSEGKKERIFYVHGMHCPSCEILVEKKVLKQPGVEAADVSLKDRQITVITESGYFDLAAVNQELTPLGYEISPKPVDRTHERLMTLTNDGRLLFSKKRLKHLLKNTALVIGVLVAFFVIEKAQLGKFVSVDASSRYSAFFLLGLVAGVSSCAALIGGLLLSLVKQWHELYIDTESRFKKAQPHLLFHVGRLSSFFILGGLLGLVGDAITFDNTKVYSLIVIAVSVLMLFLAFQMLGATWATKLLPKLPKFITRAAARDDAVKGKLMPFVTGAGTFFLPCGFTLIAQGIALSTGSFLGGALTMLYFALGTAITLVSISMGGLLFTRKPQLTARFSFVAGMVIIIFALYNINGQFNVLGWSSISDIKFARSVQSPSENPVGQVKGEQTIPLLAKDFDYIATGETKLKAGVPTTLVVDNQGIQGCGAYLSANGLIKGFFQLRRGENIIDLGSPKAGSYKITCSMGMVAPVTVTFN